MIDNPPLFGYLPADGCRKSVLLSYETIGELVLGAIGETGLTAFGLTAFQTAGLVGGTVVTAATIGGSIGLNALLSKPAAAPGVQPGAPALPSPEAGSIPVRQAIAPRIVGYGRVRLAGAYVLFEANAGVSYDIIAFHHGKISAIVGLYLDDDVITINGSGVVDVQGDNRYENGCVTVKTRLGAVPETAYSEITTPLSAIWTSAHRGDGLASLALICSQAATPTIHATQYPRGKPTPSVVADCTAIYDPRDATQSLADPTTWKVSSNPVLQLIDFLTNSDRGMGFDWSTLIAPVLASLVAEARLCGLTVPRKDAGSSESRYHSDGSFPLDSDPADVISSILDTCDGWISQNGDGSLALKVGYFRPPSVTISSKHIRGVSLQYDVGNEQAVNEFTIDYTEAALDYKTVPGQPWRDEDDISARGKVLSQRLALPWVCSHSQARRLAKRKMAQARAPLRGTITTTLFGIQALGERWININAPDIPDLANLVIEVRSATIDLLNDAMTFTFVSVDPATIDAWDPATEEGSAPTIAAKLISTPPPVPQNIVAIPVNFDPGQHAFNVECDDPGRSDLTFQTEWRVNGSGGAFTQDAKQSPFSTVNHTGDPNNSAGPGPNVHGGYGAATGTTYEVKMRAFAPSGPGSAFSASTTVTTNPF